MDSPADARKDPAQGRLFSNTELSDLVSSFDYIKYWSRRDRDGVAYFETPGFAKFLEAVSKGDPAIQASLLRVWGIR